jgi:TetR/AcrR family transcriptional repressor of nem operon
MARQQSQPRQDLLTSAMVSFWRHGYRGVSVGDLVRDTGVSRSSLYSDYAGKEALFCAVLDHYQTQVVTPLFGRVEAAGAGLPAIRDYLRAAIVGEAMPERGLRGCLVCTSWTQVDLGEAEVVARLQSHAARLSAGFTAALTHENTQRGAGLTPEALAALGHYTMVAAQGTWTYARFADGAEELHTAADALLDHLERALG